MTSNNRRACGRGKMERIKSPLCSLHHRHHPYSIQRLQNAVGKLTTKHLLFHHSWLQENSPSLSHCPVKTLQTKPSLSLPQEPRTKVRRLFSMYQKERFLVLVVGVSMWVSCFLPFWVGGLCGLVVFWLFSMWVP